MKELLKELADHDRELEAPAGVELRLRSAFRRKYARLKWPYFGVAAAAVLAVILYPRPKPQTMEIAVFTPPVAVVPTVKPSKKVVLPRPRPREIVSEFYPLADDAPPFEQGELLRVSLPASAMRSVGIPVNEDRLGETVQADVLVGQEGLARAIRFVRFER